MGAISKQDFIKKLMQSIPRTYDAKISYFVGHEMRAKIKKCEITSLEDNWFGIHITKIFVMNKIYDVDYYFEFEPWGTIEKCPIRKCNYIRDGNYSYHYLRNFNSYESWYSHFRECVHCLAKVLESYAKRGIWSSRSSTKGVWASNTTKQNILK